MSDRDVIVKLGLDASDMERGAAKADKALDSLEGKAGSGLGFGFLAGVGAAAFNTIASAAGEAVSAVINVGSSFEAQMSKVEAISGASASDIAMITEKARQMGATTSFSASEAGKAMEYMAMAGWKATDMVEGIGGIMDLAAASGEDLGTTSDIVTDALTAFGLKAKDSGRFADVLAAASSNANTNVGLMGETFKYVAPAAGALGYTVEDMSVAIGLMANSGIKGSQAGTALRSTLTRLAKPTKESQEAMDRLGLSLTDSEGNMLSFRDIMQNMRSSFSDLTESEKASTAAMLGGQEAMSGLLAIVNASDADFEKLASSIDNAGGSAHRMAETQMDNLSGSLTKFQSAAEGLGIALYDAVKGPLTGLVEFGTSVLSGLTALFSDHRSEAKKYADQLLESVRNAQKLAESTKNWEQEAAQSVGELESYRDTLVAVANAEKANEYQKYQVSQIVAKLGSTVPELTAAWNEQTGVLSLTADEINTLINAQEDYARQSVLIKAKQDAYEALYEAELAAAKAEGAMEAEFDKAATLVNNKLSSMGEPIPMTIHSMEELQAAYNRLSDSGDNGLLDALVGIMHAVDQDQRVLDETIPVIEEMEQGVRDVEAAEQHLEKQMKSTASATEEGTKAAEENTAANAEAAAAQEAAAGRVENAQRKLSEAYKTARDEIVKAFDDAKKAAENTFSVNPFSSWADSSKNTADAMKKALTKQAEDMEKFSANMEAIKAKIGGTTGGMEFIQYLENLGPSAATAVAQMAANGDLLDQTMQEYVKATNVQDALSTNMALDALMLEQGLNLLGSKAEEWAGLTGLVQDVADSGADVSEAISKAFTEAAQVAEAVGVAIPEGLAASITSSDSPAEAIMTATQTLEDAINGRLSGLLEVANKAGISVPDSIKEGIEEGGPAAQTAFTQLMELFSGSAVKQKAAKSGKETGEAVTESTASGAKEKKGTMTEAADVAVEAYTTKVRAGASSVLSAGADMAQAGVGGAMSRTTGWSEAGAMAAAGFASGIRSGRSEVINAAAQVATDAIATAKKKLDERSPSHVFQSIGFMAGKGWAIGLSDSAELVTGATETLADSSIKSTQAAVNKIGAAFDKLQSRLLKGAARGDFADAYAEAVGRASNAVEKAVSGAEDALKKTSGNYFTALSDANAAKLERLEARQTAVRERSTAQQKAMQERHEAELAALSARQEGPQDKAAQEALKAERKALEARQTAEKKAFEASRDTAEKSLKAEIDGLKKRKEKIQKLSGEFATSVLDAYDAALESQAGRIQKALEKSLEAAAESAQDKIDTLNGKISSMRSGLLNIGLTWDADFTGTSLIENVKDQIRSIRTYEEQMNALEAKGVSKALLSEIAGMDASQASDFMETLLAMSNADLSTYDKLFVRRAKEAKRVATERYSEKVKAVKEEYTDKVEAAFAKAQKSISEMGEKTMKGFLKGMKESGYSREIRKIAKTIISSMADELEIKSPSRKAKRLASFYAEGWDIGIRGSSDKSRKAMRSYASKGVEAFQRGAETAGMRKAAAYAAAPSVRRVSAYSMAAAPELSSVPAASIGDREYKVTLITTLDGREIARGTAKYTQAELDRAETIKARRQGRP